MPDTPTAALGLAGTAEAEVVPGTPTDEEEAQ